MDIMITLFLLVYILAVVLAATLSLTYVLSALLTPEWASKYVWFLKVQRNKILHMRQRNHSQLSN